MHHFEKHLIDNGFVRNPAIGEYSTLGLIHACYTKQNKQVFFGLHEKGFAPTLIYPLPMVKIEGYSPSDYYPTTIINRLMETNSDEQILASLFNKNIVLEYKE